MGTTSFFNFLAQLVALAIEARLKTEQGHQRKMCISVLKGAFRLGLEVQAELWELHHVLKAK